MGGIKKEDGEEDEKGNNTRTIRRTERAAERKTEGEKMRNFKCSLYVSGLA